jgi:carbon storage regulator CsrA
MLVLQRRLEESVVITVPGQSPITVTVVQIDGKKIKLGFTAERSVRIDRMEVVAGTYAGPNIVPVYTGETIGPSIREACLHDERAQKICG